MVVWVVVRKGNRDRDLKQIKVVIVDMYGNNERVFLVSRKKRDQMGLRVKIENC